jgi:hypothetical protein
MDPFELFPEIFEEQFQDFMQRGRYTHTLVEEWERFYSKPAPTPDQCPHGKTKLTCGQCYFS